jgi:hypothetical protein
VVQCVQGCSVRCFGQLTQFNDKPPPGALYTSRLLASLHCKCVWLV